MTMTKEIDFGEKGEDIAVGYLKNKGYIIFKRNYHSRYGEIDIIAEKGNKLAFVEVKTRKNDSFVLGEEAVDYFKRERIIKTASDFLIKTHDSYDFSFDVCVITYTEEKGKYFYKINYIEEAFG